MGPSEEALALARHLINEYSLDVDEIALGYSIQTHIGSWNHKQGQLEFKAEFNKHG